jgi:hypothetical protein
VVEEPLSDLQGADRLQGRSEAGVDRDFRHLNLWRNESRGGNLEVPRKRPGRSFRLANSVGVARWRSWLTDDAPNESFLLERMSLAVFSAFAVAHVREASWYLEEMSLDRSGRQTFEPVRGKLDRSFPVRVHKSPRPVFPHSPPNPLKSGDKSPLPETLMSQLKWRQTALFYQIYPRSFADGIRVILDLVLNHTSDEHP